MRWATVAVRECEEAARADSDPNRPEFVLMNDRGADSAHLITQACPGKRASRRFLHHPLHAGIPEIAAPWLDATIIDGVVGSGREPCADQYAGGQDEQA